MDLNFIPPRIVMLVNHISEQQWHEFREAIHHLPIQPHLTLVKSLSRIAITILSITADIRFGRTIKTRWLFGVIKN